MNAKKYLPREDDYVLLEMLKKRDVIVYKNLV